MLKMAAPALAATAIMPNTGQAKSASAEIKTVWPERRRKIKRAWLDLLGDFPTEIPLLRPIMKKVAVEGGITRYHVSFQSEEDDRVTAWLLVPESAQKTPTPAMICIHSTTFGSGKDLAVGLSGRRPIDPPDSSVGGRAYGLSMARHGFVTLSIDLWGDGERVPASGRTMDTREFYDKHPDWSIVGKNTWDIMRSVDFLQTLDFVDHAHIGCVGLSLGGHTALFAGAFESRLAATISDGGVLDWHRKATHWGRSFKVGNSAALIKKMGYDPKTGPYVYIKKFRPYIADQSKPIPVDFDELMMMVAPRPLLILSSEWEFDNHKILPKCQKALDVYVNWEDVDGLPSVLAARQARLGYDDTLAYYKQRYNISPERMATTLNKVGAGDCISWFSWPGGHSYPPIGREYSFAWLDRWLGMPGTAYARV